MRRRSQLALAIVTVAVVLVVARVAAPAAVKRYVNGQLADMGEYRGSVADVDLFLWRGGYALRNVEVVKAAAKQQETPFVAMPQMDLTMEWRALFRGEVVGEAVMFSPVLNLVQSESAEDTQLGAGVSWPQEIRDLFPFKLNVVQVHNGLVTFRAPGISTEESLTMRNFELVLRDLTNVSEDDTAAFAPILLTGRIMGNAPFKLEGQIDPNEEIATFDVDVSLENAKLVDVNPWLREFLKVDAQDGAFSMYAELAAADGRFEGYIKPILENPEIFDSDEETSGPFQKAWEAIVGVAAKILENRREDQVATRIPFSGELDNPRAGVVAALLNLVRNAFVAAFAHSLEGSISLRDVGEDIECLNAAGNDCSKDQNATIDNDAKGELAPDESVEAADRRSERRESRRRGDDTREDARED
jgi:hypothetical protein